MNKQDLINAIVKDSGLTKKAAEQFLQSFTTTVQKAVKKNDKVSLIGFGSWELKKRAARQGVNPQTKAKIKIPATKVPSFRAGKAFKDLVNNKKK
jgi:DNA-binding protein HU-beta